jgi:superoxide dismutase, Fe-Mn family
MRDIIDLLESTKKLELAKLPYSHSALSPVLSRANIDFHYGKLAKGYVDRYNKGEGDKNFNEAGAFLHNIFFTQFRSPKNGNPPRGKILDIINLHHSSWVDFKKHFKEEALKVQGSGWIYLSKSGQIKTIKNHAKRTDIALLIDMWEHSYQNDYHSDKAKYIDSLWRIMNWDAINKRL